MLAEVECLAAAPLWPGFDPDRIPLAFSTPQQTFLIRHPRPPAAFTRLRGQPELWVYPGIFPAIRANSVVELHRRITATIQLQRQRHSARALAALVIHEAFHVFQREHHPDWWPNEANLFTYPTDDVNALALRRLETVALHHAVRARSSLSRTRWIATALAQRHERYCLLPAEAIAYERGTELIEGLAQYIEHKAIRATRRPILRPADFPAEDIRPRCYAVGHVFAWLLNDVLPSWQTQLEAGTSATLDTLLTLALTQYPARPMAIAGAMREAALTQARAEIAALVTARQERRAAFLTAPGWRVVIQARREQPLWPQGFDPLHVRRLTATDILHTRWLKVGHATATIEVLDREALTVGTLAHPVFAGIEVLTLTGLPVAPTIQNIGAGVAIHAPGLTATFQHPAIECWQEERLLLIHC